MLGKFRNYIEDRGRCIRIFREKEDSVVALIRKDGEDRVCRMYAHPVPAYAIAAELACSALPVVYSCEADEDGCYIVEEEFVDGISLGELMEVYHPDSSQTAAIATQICAALEALHGRGVIHRDVKPENVLITSAGRVVLIDLDAATEYDEKKTRDTTLLGTAGYAAPEQFGFSRSNVRTDIFSLGVMMNVMLTGEHPSTCLTDSALRDIIEKCIEINVDKRYASASELKKALDKHASAPSVCAECGFISPGGGCLCCGMPSAGELLQKKRAKKLLLAGILAVIAVICACIWLPRERTEIQTPEISTPVNTPQTSLTPAPESTEPSQTEETKPPITVARQLYFSRHAWPDQLQDYAVINSDLKGVMVHFWLDAEGTQPLPGDCALECSDGIGEISYSAQHDCWLWSTVGVRPDSWSGENHISALVDGVEYRMRAATNPLPYMLYSSAEVDWNEADKNYIPSFDAMAYNFTFSESARSVFAVPMNVNMQRVYACDAESLTWDSAAFECVLDETNGVIEIRYNGDLNAWEACNVSFNVTAPYSSSSDVMQRKFSIAHMPESQKAVKQLYSSMLMGGNLTAMQRMQLPAENRTAPLFWLDTKMEVPVPGDAVINCPPELGTIVRDNVNQCWSWSTRGAAPGATGWISVEIDGIVYRIMAEIGRPWYALYTEPTVDPKDQSKNYVFKDENGKMSFRYSDAKRTAYIIPLQNLQIVKYSLSGNTDAFSCSLDEAGVLHLTLKDGVSGSLATDLSLQGSMTYNDSDFRATLKIEFVSE